MSLVMIMPIGFLIFILFSTNVFAYGKSINKDNTQFGDNGSYTDKNAEINAGKSKSQGASSPTPPSIGNFALPSSQQPGALLSFGQYIIDKGDTLVYLLPDDFVGKDKHFVNAYPYLVHAPSDKSSIIVAVPYAVDYRDGESRSSGIQDCYFQYEYAFYASPSNTSFLDFASVFASVFVPTGSVNKVPATGFGSTSYFMGVSYGRWYTDWLYFISPISVLFTTKHHGTQLGREYFYQGGIGRNICYSESKWIFNWILEIDGTYTEKDVFQNEVDPDSGGNIVYVTPSLWFSTQKITLQLGFGVPVTQKWNGDQTKFKYLLIGSFSWKF